MKLKIKLSFFVILLGLFNGFMIQCNSTKPEKGVPSNLVFKDGTYRSFVKDWPSMDVEVKIENGKLNQITILESDGTEALLEEVKNKLIPLMIQQGTYDVDGVSGATMSSDHLKLAIKQASCFNTMKR